ncbi:MAG: hypothetical protein OXN79_05900, partial [bacterium]|nr:hypothetical protein [bacterium]
MIHTYGPGAVVDLPSMAVVVGNTSTWDIHYTRVIAEDRLLGNVRSMPECDRVTALRSPPWAEEGNNPFEGWAWVGVPVYP